VDEQKTKRGASYTMRGRRLFSSEKRKERKGGEAFTGEVA